MKPMENGDFGILMICERELDFLGMMVEIGEHIMFCHCTGIGGFE